MASVNWQKVKSVQEVKAIIRHDCTDSREAHSHTNEDIDVSMTVSNTDFLGGYDTCVAAYDKRMSELPPPVRKDAVVGLGFSIPLPHGLPSGAEDEWAEKVFGLMATSYGKDNIVCFVLHRDEVHEYIDPDTHEHKMSRPHVQGIIIPETGGRLCAKEITARSRMQSINKEIHAMTTRDYQLDWMDGTKAKSRGSVETLKQRSAMAELQERIEQLAAENQRLEERNKGLQEKVDGVMSLPRAVFGRIKSDADRKRDLAEEAARDAAERQARAEAALHDAEKKAAEAAQRASDAILEAKRARDTLDSDRAACEALRRDMEDIAKQAEKINQKLKCYNQPVTVSERRMIDVMRSLTMKNGESLYEYVRQAALKQQQTAKRDSKVAMSSLTDLIADAKARSRHIEGSSRQESRDDSLTL